MLKEHIKKMVQSLFDGDPVKAESHFKSVMDRKLSDSLEARKTLVAAQLFGTRVSRVAEDYSKMSDAELDAAKPPDTGGANSGDPTGHRASVNWAKEKDRRLAAAKKNKGKSK